jgi:hypothetical protein
MGGITLRGALFAAAALVIVGCKGPAADHSYPNDPLLITYQPIEGKAESAKPSTVIHREPQVPPRPSATLVAKSTPQAESSLVQASVKSD